MEIQLNSHAKVSKDYRSFINNFDMLNADFLENFPLLKKSFYEVPKLLGQFTKVPIHMACNICASEQTFSMVNEFHELTGYVHSASKGLCIRLLYRCRSCDKFEREFYIYIDSQLKFIYKIGQYPEWEIKIDKKLEKALGKHISFFRKGLVCESQSYGIGAFAYYRRIVEEIIDELIDSISDLIEPENKEKYLAALELTKKTRVTQEKIELVKDLMPSILKPEGMNPLGVLHSELSSGLHGQTDEVCLEKAEHIKTILTFLITQIIQAKESGKSFSDSMKKLLNKKSDLSKK